MPSPKPSRKQIPALALGELTGETVIVGKHSCRGMEGIEGTVTNETLNTLVIATKSGERRVPKKGGEFVFPQHKTTIKGADLLHRPEDRTKKLA